MIHIQRKHKEKKENSEKKIGEITVYTDAVLRGGNCYTSNYLIIVIHNDWSGIKPWPI